ncbi:hypothetical protein CDR19_25180 [Ectopseudomonas toyotomiensis]|uniref:hypothetical protein n=1 Tax=Ectopseudomonas toyotomiensis TaxID=554344 RepID=UPI000944B4DD|nr:hypothetical protein [Pseudomonas toyotomiensis]PIA66381.1 hypothetical protein CDR19_25180 [Pseudomonas toyotomiensis]
MNTLDPSTLTSPHAYAAAVLAEPSLDGRQWLMGRCPADWRALVEEHVNSAWSKVAAYRRHRAGREEQAREKPTAAQRRDASPKPRRVTKSAPEVGNAAIAKLRAVVGKGAA